jgi:hypothetical protein
MTAQEPVGVLFDVDDTLLHNDGSRRTWRSDSASTSSVAATVTGNS